MATARTLVAKREQKIAAAFHEVSDKEQDGANEEAGGEEVGEVEEIGVREVVLGEDSDNRED